MPRVHSASRLGPLRERGTGSFDYAYSMLAWRRWMSKLLDTAPGVREHGLRSQRIPEPARGERWGSSSLHRGRGHVEELRMEWEPAGWIYPGLEGGNRGELRLGPSGRRVLGLLAGNLAWWSLWLGALRGFLWEIRLSWYLVCWRMSPSSSYRL